MKASISDDIRQLLPELFRPTDPDKKGAGGMCTPESGCGPAKEETAMDIVRLLSEKGSAGAAAPSMEKTVSENHDPKKTP
jgi:hypothetical protein